MIASEHLAHEKKRSISIRCSVHNGYSPSGLEPVPPLLFARQEEWSYSSNSPLSRLLRNFDASVNGEQIMTWKCVRVDCSRVDSLLRHFLQKVFALQSVSSYSSCAYLWILTLNRTATPRGLMLLRILFDLSFDTWYVLKQNIEGRFCETIRQASFRIKRLVNTNLTDTHKPHWGEHHLIEWIQPWNHPFWMARQEAKLPT